MKRDSGKAGIGFAMIVATATFVIAVIAGIVFIRETAGTSTSQLEAPDPPRISLVTPDVKRGPQAARPFADEPGINTAPKPAP